jgi:hypothetical protein
VFVPLNFLLLIVGMVGTICALSWAIAYLLFSPR